MPAFEYEALDERGRKSKGLITADSEYAARRELRSRSMAPLSLRSAENRQVARSGDGESLMDRLRAQDLSSRELMLITRQMSSLIGAGMPVAETLGLLAEQGARHHMKRVLLAVRGRVSEGARLSEAMQGFPRSFPAVYRAMVAAGEQAGGLDAVLARLADYLEKEEAVKNRITGALVYPVVLSVVALGVVALLMTFVVPKIAEQFTGMGMELPMLTQIMIGLSAALLVSWPFILAGLGALVVVTVLALRQTAIRTMFDGFLVRLPLLGGFLRQVEAARFARTMGILIESGSVLPEALGAASRASGNLAFRAKVETVRASVETGRGLSDALQASRWFPSLMLFMVAAGERSGALGEMFRRAADQMEQEIDGAVTVGLNLLEPGIILALGGVVVVIVLSILLPILQLNTLALG
ncbi:type II secretion system inner membrane protein GspF [Maricaulis parjimensis]|uniref:type II secretion system inner membrane protein GspF n=1 Tax=Maricaulis parjimensis TaxID=144023 RepID=UPI00193A056D|nr:type II secretion system inner membrane protein GspF [Maricaulis parjimensis]